MCFASLRYSARLFAAVCAFVLFWALVLCCAQLYIMVRHVKFRRTVHLTFTAMGPSSIWRVSDMNDEQQCPNVPIVVAVVCVIYQCSRTWGISSFFFILDGFISCSNGLFLRSMSKFAGKGIRGASWISKI